MTGENSTTRTRRLSVVALSALLAIAGACETGQGGSASPSRERRVEQTPWDAEEVAALSAQLVDQLVAVRQSVRLEPGMQERVRLQSKAAVRLSDTLRSLEKSAKQLAARVAGGGGLEDTDGIIRKIASQLRSAKIDARSQMLGETTLGLVEQARGTLRALSPFYGTQLDPAETTT